MRWGNVRLGSVALWTEVTYQKGRKDAMGSSSSMSELDVSGLLFLCNDVLEAVDNERCECSEVNPVLLLLTATVGFAPLLRPCATVGFLSLFISSIPSGDNGSYNNQARFRKDKLDDVLAAMQGLDRDNRSDIK